MSLAEVVRTASERFNEKDFKGVVALFHPDVEWADVLQEGVTIRGPAAILKLWTERFSDADIRMLLGDVVEVAGTATAVACYLAYESGGAPVGSPLVVAHRFSFRDGLLARADANVLDEVPSEMKELFKVD